jgi:hypothetical protein
MSGPPLTTSLIIINVINTNCINLKHLLPSLVKQNDSSSKFQLSISQLRFRESEQHFLLTQIKLKQFRKYDLRQGALPRQETNKIKRRKTRCN